MIENCIICDDTLIGLKKLPDNFVTLVITSPPYNLKISYNSAADNQPYKDYLAWLKQIFTECKRVLRKGGRLIINIDAMTNRQEDKDDEYVRPIYVDLGIMMREINMKFFGEHIWYKSSKDPSYNGGQFNGKKTAWGSYMSPSLPAVRRNHEYVLVYSKDQFQLEPDENSGEPDINGAEFQEYIASTWSMQPETKKLGNHPVPFCEELPYRCIKLYSYSNDLVLDPFNGVGTTTFIANMLGRRYIGIDMDPNYCDYAISRISTGTDMMVKVIKEKATKREKKRVEEEQSIDMLG